MANYIAIDVGGTKIAIGAGNERGELNAVEFMATDPGWSQDEVLERIVRTADRMCQRLGLSTKDFSRVGLGTPGPLDGPVLLETSNLHGWKGLNWAEGLESRLKLPVSVENDATAAGVGEWCYGAGRGARDCIYVTVSTGIGAGIIANGMLYSGSRGNAGEFGHLVMDPDGVSCAAGHRGCLESLASGSAIGRNGRAQQQASEFLRKIARIEAKDVMNGYVAGDPICVNIIQAAADRLALGMSYLVNLFNPERIILGGGVGTHAPQSYRDRLMEGISRWALPALCETVRIVPAALGEDSGVIGALALAVTASS